MGGHVAGYNTILENVDFSTLDCTNVQFSGATFKSTAFGLVANDLRFYSASLVNASFAGAILRWKNVVADYDDWFEYFGDGPDTQRVRTLLTCVRGGGFGGYKLS